MSGTENIINSLETLIKIQFGICTYTFRQEVLDFIIVRESPESYIPQIREVPQQMEPHIQLGALLDNSIDFTLEMWYTIEVINSSHITGGR